ncbi:2-oxoglutarate dehydrogenase, E2 component, dihydrolipoamide succinyltransferase [Brevibacterium luteolum]|nr:2-oxoglutarate dehydrogenase, E2 component, dihydrolipoamide succinyltransferase [Brevibacterium luteolum]
MSNKVQMPALGESVTEGTVTRWLKEVGEEVEVDEPLLEVSTDKVDTEIPSPYAGTLQEILADEDDVVEVGGDLAVIGDGDGDSSDDSSDEDADSDDADSSDDAAEGQAEADSDDEDSADEDSADEADDGDEDAADDSDDSADDSDDADDSEEKPKKQSSGGSGDSTEVKMPALGESVTEGTVTRWLKEVGDEVEVDEPLLEVSTDKVDTEVPSPVAGTVQKLMADEDDVVEVGDVVALIGSGDAPADDSEDADDSDDSDEAETTDRKTEQADDVSEEDTDDDVKEEPEEDDESDDSEVKDKESDAKAAKDEAEKSEKSEEDAAAEAQKAAAEQAAGEEAKQSISSTVAHGSVYVTPLVRRLAKNKGVDLSKVTGTGVGGRIRKQDVLSAAENTGGAKSGGAPAPAAAKPAVTDDREPFVVEIPEEVKKLRGTTQKASRIRQTIATRMRESLQNSAQLTQVIEVDMTRVGQLRKAYKDQFQQTHGVKLTYLPFFAKAIVEALQVHPKVNATYDVEAKEITYFDHENLAVAVDTERGLLVPVVKDAGDLSIAGLAKAIDDVAERTRTAKIGPDELSGGTFTVTNIGSVGALFDTPILNTPQMGILGTGVITRRPVVVETADGGESIAIRDMVYLPLTYNHELVDGADAGRFLQTIKARLEDANFVADLEL